MSKEIALAEVRAGDTIRVTREFKVDSVDSDRLHSTGLPTGWMQATGATIELLDRPIDLPTKKGSIIRVRTGHMDGPGVNHGTWILTENSGGLNPRWMSASRVSMTRSEFAEFLVETPARTFEVVA